MNTMRLHRIAAALTVGVALAGISSSARAGAPTGPKPGVVPPEINCTGWLNSGPLSLKALRGRVVLLEFWSPG